MKATKHGRGVTLVELSTTLLAVAVVLTLGIPAFQGLHTDMQCDQVSSALMASFAQARSEAVRRGVDIRVCPSADGSTCGSASGADWSSGWIVASAEGGAPQILEATQFGRTPSFAITSDEALAGGVTLSSTGLPSATGSLTYTDGSRRFLFRLMPIGRLEPAP